MSSMRFSCRGALKSPVPTHEPIHLPPILVPGVNSSPDSGSFGAAGALAAGVLAAGAPAAGACVAGVGVASALVTTGVVVLSVGSVVVEVAGSPVVSVVPAAASVPGGASTRVPDGSDLLKTEHAASSGLIASTNSTRIEPPLAACIHLVPRARLVPELQLSMPTALRG